MAPSIRPVTKCIWSERTRLKVRADQAGFFASNVRSIAEARFLDDDEDGHSQWQSYSFGVDEGGDPSGASLISISHRPPGEQAYILRLMVDEKYPGRVADSEVQALLRAKIQAITH